MKTGREAREGWGQTRKKVGMGESKVDGMEGWRQVGKIRRDRRR